MYYNRMRYPSYPFRYPSYYGVRQGNFDYLNNLWQGARGYMENIWQNNFGYLNNLLSSMNGYINNISQRNYAYNNGHNMPQGSNGYTNNRFPGNYGYNMPNGNYGYSNGQMQGSNGYMNTQFQGGNEYTNTMPQGYPNTTAQGGNIYTNAAQQGYANTSPQGGNIYTNTMQQGYANTTPQGGNIYTNAAQQGYANTTPQGSRYPNSNRMNTTGFKRSIDNTAASDIKITDNGPKPYVVSIDNAVKKNDTFRTALWTGEQLQLVLMSINPGEDMGFEVDSDLDQFICIEEGSGILVMGDQKENLDFHKTVSADDAFIIPAGKWHNLVNSDNKPLKLYTVYTPKRHPFGTVHATKETSKPADKKEIVYVKDIKPLN